MIDLSPAKATPGATGRFAWTRHGETARLAALGVLLVAVAIVITAVSLHRITKLELAVDGLALDVTPATSALQQLRTAQLENVMTFEDALLAPDAVSRALLFDESRRSLSTSEAAWLEFRRTSRSLAGEAELVARYEELRGRLDALTGLVGLAVLEEVDVATVAGAPAFEELRAVRGELHLIGDQLLNDIYGDEVAARTATLQADVARARNEALLLIALTVVCGAIGFTVALRAARRRELAAAAVDAERAERSRREGLEARLHRALDMARSESAAFDVVQRSLIALVPPDSPAELLVADGADANFQRVTGTDAHGSLPGCPVVSPASCPAASGSETREFLDSEELDACPHLRDRPQGSCSAVCVPVRLAETGTAVIHLIGARSVPTERRVVADLEMLAAQAGERIGMVRLLAETTQQARHDSLTGLLNRRSLENAARRLQQDQAQFVVAYGDLDRFKALNDTHGHEAGDRALRLFSRVLRDSVRPMDLVSRYGGEEFLVVLPHCTPTEAAEVIERVRRSLHEEVQGSSIPSFTTSFGIAQAREDSTFEEAVGRADRALMAAKAAGRDRVLLDGEPAPTLRDA